VCGAYCFLRAAWRRPSHNYSYACPLTSSKHITINTTGLPPQQPEPQQPPPPTTIVGGGAAPGEPPIEFKLDWEPVAAAATPSAATAAEPPRALAAVGGASGLADAAEEGEEPSAVQKFLFPDKEELPDDFELPIWDHLEELRERVLVAGLAAAVAVAACFCYSKVGARGGRSWRLCVVCAAGEGLQTHDQKQACPTQTFTTKQPPTQPQNQPEKPKQRSWCCF
jgi:hypothetical protein